MRPAINLVGQKFGLWTVIKREIHKTRVRLRWHCICDCGAEGYVYGEHLRAGRSMSCGCLRPLLVSNFHTKHGAYRTSEYKIWKGMHYRCEHHPDYAGRGIVVCERWYSFENFLEDMGPRPSGRSIDRIDNNGPYSPENCRWATITEQNRNTRTVRRITWNGSTKPITEWAAEFGVTKRVIAGRLSRGRSVEEIFASLRRVATAEGVLQ